MVAVGVGPAAAETLAPRPVGPGSSSPPSTGAPVSTGSATVSGSGFGHGVGMSQYGAYGMAKAGASAAQILTHYYTGVNVAQTADATDLRVNVVHRGRSIILQPQALSGSGQLMTLNTVEGQTLTLTPGDTARLTPSGAGLAVAVARSSSSAGSGPTSVTTTGLGVRWTGTEAVSGSPTLAAMRADISGTLSTKVRSYRWGRLWVNSLSGLLEAVVTVDLHSEYLRGVAEMPSSWPAAALQAQATVARSYALVAAAGSKSGCGGCQIWDDQRSQVYAGWSKESERIGSVDYGSRWVAAVAATQATSTTGAAVLYQGSPINAVYFSSSGGRTRDSSTVWGGTVPYLKTTDDAWSLDSALNPRYAAWNRAVPVTTLTSLFALPDLVSITVTARDGAGAATTLRAVSGSGRSASIGGETFRSRLGLPSSWVGAVALPSA